MEVKISKQQQLFLSSYLENKETADQIIGAVQEHQLTLQETEDVFNVILSLFDKMPAIPADTSISLERGVER